MDSCKEGMLVSDTVFYVLDGRADWSTHKPTCTPADKCRQKTVEGSQNTIMAWMKKNYYEVMVGIERCVRVDKVAKKDLMMEVDFCVDTKTGEAPALKCPPEFRVGRASDGLEGSRPKEANWFLKGTDVYDKNVGQFLQSARDQFSRTTDDHVFVIVRHASRNPSV